MVPDCHLLVLKLIHHENERGLAFHFWKQMLLVLRFRLDGWHDLHPFIIDCAVTGERKASYKTVHSWLWMFQANLLKGNDMANRILVVNEFKHLLSLSVLWFEFLELADGVGCLNVSSCWLVVQQICLKLLMLNLRFRFEACKLSCGHRRFLVLRFDFFLSLFFLAFFISECVACHKCVFLLVLAKLSFPGLKNFALAISKRALFRI